MAKATTMSQEQRVIVDRLTSIFFPHSIQRSKELYGENPADDSTSLFVHYTSAENALKIIRTKRWWMRSTSCTIDYREAHHGHQILLELDREEELKVLWSAIEECQQGAGQEAIGAFNDHIDRLLTETYIACISEFENKDA